MNQNWQTGAGAHLSFTVQNQLKMVRGFKLLNMSNPLVGNFPPFWNS